MISPEYIDQMRKKFRQALSSCRKYQTRLNVLTRLTDDILSDTERQLGPYGDEWESLCNSAVTFKTQYEGLNHFYNKSQMFFKEMLTDPLERYPEKYLRKLDRCADQSLRHFASVEQELDERIDIIKESIRLYHELELLEC